MTESYQEFEATSLFCPRCRKAVPVRKKLLLVLPTGTKYDYLCAECGTPVGGKVDADPTEFRRTVPRPGTSADSPVLGRGPGSPGQRPSGLRGGRRLPPGVFPGVPPRKPGRRP